MPRIINNDVARFWSKVDKNGPLPTNRPELGPCWKWLAGFDAAGYARFFGGKTLKCSSAHVFSYVLHKGPVPFGKELDHLCRNRGCPNPAHLEAVTHQENILRGDTVPARHAAATHCPAGHAYDEANTFRNNRGERQCRVCYRTRSIEKGHRSLGVMHSGPRKLTDADVMEMHQLAGQGVKYGAIAERFEMSYSSVEKIIRGFRWPEIHALFHAPPLPHPELTLTAA